MVPCESVSSDHVAHVVAAATSEMEVDEDSQMPSTAPRRSPISRADLTFEEEEDLEGGEQEHACEHWDLPESNLCPNNICSNSSIATTNHATRPASSGFIFVELFSGLGAFTMVLLALGGWLLGYCESNPTSWLTFKHKFADAFHVQEYMDLDGYDPFLNWCEQKEKSIDLMVGGPSCKSFSIAGKQDWDNPRALCAPNTAKVAGKLQPKMVGVEITVELYTNNHAHGLFTLMVQNFKEEGYELASVEMVRDSELGGNQSRRRLLTTWERWDVHQLLPPVTSIFEYTEMPSAIRPLLEPVELLPAFCWLHGNITMLTQHRPTSCKLYPIQVATLRWGGPNKALREGSMVNVTKLGAAQWRVVQVAAQKVRVVRPNTPTDQRSHWVLKQEANHLSQVEKVYSIDGVCVPIRTWGESLAGAGMLVWMIDQTCPG